MRLQELQHKWTSGKALTYHYQGVPIFCTGGIHEGIFDAFRKRNIAHDSPLLVLGSGAGGFEKRLLDNGYTNITSVEFIPENFQVKGTKFLSLDLNEDFSHLGTFDAIFAIELIEHLENPFHFIRCIKKLLNHKGYFYLTTPNVEQSFARIKFFLTGRLHWFGQAELTGTGHISPIFNHILKFNLKRNDMEIKQYFGNANIWRKLIQHHNWGIKAAYALCWPISFLLPRANNFEINLFEITHKKNS